MLAWVRIFLLEIELHLFTADSKSNSSREGPSILIRCKASNVTDLSLLRIRVFTHFIVENACSQSAVLIGITRAKLAKQDSCG